MDIGIQRGHAAGIRWLSGTRGGADPQTCSYLSPVVQIGRVGGPPRRSADKTPNHPPAVRTKNLQVASSTRAANAGVLGGRSVLAVGVWASGCVLEAAWLGAGSARGHGPSKKNYKWLVRRGGREAQNKPVVQRVRNTRLYIWESPDVEQNEHASSPNTRPEMTSGEHGVFTVIRGGRATQR